MVYFAENGVGRTERVSGATRVFDIPSAVYNYAATETINSTALAAHLKVVGVQVSVGMKQDVAGTATAPYLNLFIDEKPIATIAPSTSNQTDWFYTAIIPVEIYTNPSSTFRFAYAPGTETGDYGIVAAFKVFAIEI